MTQMCSDHQESTLQLGQMCTRDRRPSRLAAAAAAAAANSEVQWHWPPPPPPALAVSTNWDGLFLCLSAVFYDQLLLSFSRYVTQRAVRKEWVSSATVVVISLHINTVLFHGHFFLCVCLFCFKCDDDTEATTAKHRCTAVVSVCGKAEKANSRSFSPSHSQLRRC